MGQIHLMRNEPQRAAELLEQALAANPFDPDVLNSLGAARVGLGDLDGAEAAYRKALDRGEFGEVWFNLGVVAERRGAGHQSVAAARYRRASEINPLDPRPRANLAALESGAPGTGVGEPRSR
jgi:Flp pilus assembly protein TadD